VRRSLATAGGSKRPVPPCNKSLIIETSLYSPHHGFLLRRERFVDALAVDHARDLPSSFSAAISQLVNRRPLFPASGGQ